MEKAGVKKDKAIDALKKAGTVQGAILLLKEEKPREGIFEPFTSIIDGFKEILNIQSKKPEAVLPLRKQEEEAEKNKAKGEAAAISWILYDVYKKSHGYLNPL